MGHSSTGCTWCMRGRKERREHHQYETKLTLKQKQALRYPDLSLRCVKLLAKARELLYQFLEEEATLQSQVEIFSLPLRF